jgi:hypothetical protein
MMSQLPKSTCFIGCRDGAGDDAADAQTSERKCEDNNKQHASCRHQNLGGVKDFNGSMPAAATLFPASG